MSEHITDTHPVRGIAYALHDTFGYNERWSTDEAGKEILDHLRRNGFNVVRSDEQMDMWRDGYEAGRNDFADENGYGE